LPRGADGATLRKEKGRHYPTLPFWLLTVLPRLPCRAVPMPAPVVKVALNQERWVRAVGGLTARYSLLAEP
jgi:hypothetical protein